MKKRLWFIFLFTILGLCLYFSKIITLKNNYFKYSNLLIYRFNKVNPDIYKIDLVSLYMKSLKNNHFKIKTIKIPLHEKTKINNDTPTIAYNDIPNPLVYIYSTHTNEEYNYSKNDLYNIIPTVKTANYILEEELNKLGINSLVEIENTYNILKNKGLNHNSSYKISRTYLEKRKEENSNLNYFIDIHRDSVKNTTIEINGIKYAKILFILGLENTNYLENKQAITKLNDYLNINYPGLSKGIYEKKGEGVNGIYNQDYSKNVFLIEVGGIENNILEVSNSLKVIASSLYNYINEI